MTINSRSPNPDKLNFLDLKMSQTQLPGSDLSARGGLIIKKKVKQEADVDFKKPSLLGLERMGYSSSSKENDKHRSFSKKSYRAQAERKREDSKRQERQFRKPDNEPETSKSRVSAWLERSLGDKTERQMGVPFSESKKERLQSK